MDENGDLFVYGKATDDTLDQDKQILDKEFMEKAMGDWFKDWGNIRQQHSTSLPPAGKAMGLDVKDDGIYVRAKVIEPVAKELVKQGVYQAYSVGVSNPRIIRDMDAPNGRVVGGIVSEISLVDRPANTNCRLTVAKRQGSALVAVDDMYVGDTFVAKSERPGLVKGAIALMLKMDDIQHKPEDGTEWDEDVNKGDTPGHPMRGNQHVTPAQAAAEATPSQRAEMQSEANAQLEDAENQAQLVGAKVSKKAKKRAQKSATISDTTTQENDGMNKGAKNTTAGEKPAPLPAEPGDASVSGNVGDDRIMKDGGMAPASGPPTSGTGAPPPVEDTRSDVGGAPVAAPVAPPVAKSDDDPDDDGDDDSLDGDDNDDDLDKGVGAFDAVPEVTGAKVKKGKKGKQGSVPPDSLDESLMTPDVDSGVDTNSDMGKGFPPAVLRLHDATCAAYSDKAIVKAYGDDATTIIRNTAQEVMFTALRNAVAADMGKGVHVGSIVDLTDAYSVASLMAIAAPATIKEVRAEIHKSFVDENKDMLANTDSIPSPKNAGQPQASSYKRPLITSGQSKPTATGGGDSGARIPSSGDTPKASEFTGNGVTSGQERPSPATKSSRIGPAGSSSGTYFNNAAKDQAASAMTALHDHISYTFPDMCPMAPDSGLANTPAHGEGRVSTRQTSGPVSVPQGAAKESNAVVNKVYTGDADVVDNSDDIRKMAKKLKKAQKSNAELQAQLDTLGSQPDPFRAPVRGVMMGTIYGGEESRILKSEVEEYAEMLALSADPNYRLRAENVLNKINK